MHFQDLLKVYQSMIKNKRLISLIPKHSNRNVSNFLLKIIKKLIDEGNTVVCVEHDETFIRSADYIIDIGPEAGILGGQKIFEGSFEEFLKSKTSRTSPYFVDNTFPIPEKYRKKSGQILSIKNANIHNLQNVDVDIPLGIMVGIAGVSGSGKSSLISNTLVPGLKALMHGKCITGDEKSTDKIDDEFLDQEEDEEFSEEENLSEETKILGHEQIKKCYVIDQCPIGRSRTSCPATYTGIMDRMRKLFSECDEAKAKGLGIGYFSLNSKGGCPMCHGDGVIHRHIGFGNFIDLKCDKCDGFGFVADTMKVHLDGKTIKDCLEMSVSEAYDFFKDKEHII